MKRGYGIATALLVAASCAPKHPNDPSIPDRLCAPRCAKLRACDPTYDEVACRNRCRQGLSPRVIYDRKDYVDAIEACANQQTCGPDIQQRVQSCVRDVGARLEPTGAVRLFCANKVRKDDECHSRGSFDYDHCLLGYKVLSDAIASQLTDCLDDPCHRYRRCFLAVLGDDEVAMDRDRQEEFRTKPVPAAPSALTMSGKVVTLGTTTPVAAAKLCVHDRADMACATTDGEGAFSLQIPPDQEFALELTAPDYAPTIEAVTPKTKDTKNWTFGLRRLATVRPRYAVFGATYPDAATGFVVARALGPQGSATGIDGVEMAIEPKSGAGPFFFSPNSDPDPARHATSTFATGLFANVAPGIVEVSFDPAGLTCSPAFGGWASTKPNTVRVPVVAGFETDIGQRCNK